MRRIVFPIFLCLSVCLTATHVSATPTAPPTATQTPEPASIERDRFTVNVDGEGRDVILIPGLASPRDV